MTSLSVDTSNEDLFKPYEPKLLPNGKHTFEVANNLAVTKAKPPSENSIIKIEARCVDNDDNKGAVVFENIVIIADASTEKGMKSKKINEGRLAQFTVACGVLTEEQIKAGESIPLDQFAEKQFEAISKQRSSTDPNTGQTRLQNGISRYLFEPAKTE